MSEAARKNATPMLATQAWKDAVRRAGEQCEGGKTDVRKKEWTRCSHQLAGGYRLFLGGDGRVRCDEHHSKREAENRRVRRQAAALPNPDQTDLFEGLMYSDEQQDRMGGSGDDGTRPGVRRPAGNRSSRDGLR